MTTIQSDIVRLSAAELAARVHAGEITAVDATEAYLSRIAEVNPRLNAIVVPLFDEARVAAQAADASRARGDDLGPLHGVPITIKDQFEVKGTPATWGVKHRQRVLAPEDGPLVARLRQAGAIILGKTNVPQLLFYAESDNPVYGRTNNPWDPARAPGGSSGGEGAIISAGGSALGLGSDIGGSLRVPAHFCGIATIKPTAFRLTGKDNPAFFANGQEGIIAQSGPMARTVADVILGFKILSAPGQETFDTFVPPVPWRDPADVRIQGMRVAMYDDDGFFPASPGVRRAVREAADALRDAGAIVETWQPLDPTFGMHLFVAILGADGGKGFARMLQGEKPTPQIAALFQAAHMLGALRPGAIGALGMAGQRRTAEMVRHIRPRSADGYWQLTNQRAIYREQFSAALRAGGYDAIICPPHALPALTHGASEDVSLAASYSMLYNLLGMPAGVVPVTRVRAGEESDRRASRDRIERTARKVEAGSAGLPLGVQVVSHHWREDIALAVMSAIEARVRTNADFPAWPPL
jgi:fatty acid amide hydrolase